jgi:2-hydroxycyclohexanecarboxyl-CoA dehydrogenase
MAMKLDNKVAVITGAGSGIGLATAHAFAAAGAHVAVAEIAADKGTKAVSEIRGAGGTAEFFQVDVTDAKSIAAMRQAVLAWRPEVDIVANVAGWGRIQPFIDNTPEYWDKVIALNLMGPIAVTRAFIEGMFARKAGKIVTVASDAGRVGSLGETVYAAAKGGAIAFTKSLAREAARFNVNVNCVCPGPTDTPLLAAVPEKHQEAFIRATPMRRLGRPEEVADAVLFLSSDQASFITGQILSVNGGLVIPG